jgi:hypothetical protein
VGGLIQIQRDFVTPGKPETDYMHGMLNGLIMAQSVFANIHNPKFHTLPRKNRNTKIRHKGKR